MNQNSNRLTFGVLATGAGVVLMMQSLVAPALPTMQHSLHTSQSTAVWVMTANLLSASIFTPILGRIGDLFDQFQRRSVPAPYFAAPPQAGHYGDARLPVATATELGTRRRAGPRGAIRTIVQTLATEDS